MPHTSRLQRPLSPKAGFQVVMCPEQRWASEAIERWSLTSLRERLIKTGARLVRHGRYAIFQMAEAALPRQVFASILALINGLRGPPSTAVSA